jgi:hypothetical protein
MIAASEAKMSKSKHLIIGGGLDGQILDVEDVLIIERLMIPKIGPSGIEYDFYVRHDFGGETVFAIESMTAADVVEAILSVT